MRRKILGIVYGCVFATMFMTMFSLTGVTAHAGEMVEQQTEIYLYARELGDVDENSEVTASDALQTLQEVVKLSAFNKRQQEIADVDDSGDVTAEDALLILQKVVKLIRRFPAELNMEPEQVFGFSEEELGWMLGAKYYDNTMKKVPESSMIWKPVRIDRQGSVQCSGYATALVFRYLGEDVTGKEVYDEIPYKFDDGTVAPEVLAQYIDDKENYRAQLYMGTIEDLKESVAKGVPPIILSYVSPKSSILHFIPVTGYDEDYFYLADSYRSDKENTTSYYNRKISYEDLEEMWDIDMEFYRYLFIEIEKE